tara:strand:+ start:148 stop:375 length:228 start_codon:yes stop_codon:yes gene_type:complete
MLPLFTPAGDLRSEPFVFEKEIPAGESLALADVRALTRCAVCPRSAVPTNPSLPLPLFAPRADSRSTPLAVNAAR